MGRGAVLAVLVMVCQAAAASALNRPPVAPDDAPVVAGPTASGATLVAFDGGHRICTAVRDPEASPFADCTALPARTRSARVQIAGAGPRRLFVSLVVPAGGATEAEVVGSNGVSSRVPVGPGAYAGRLHGRVAFGLAEIAARSLRIVRFFDQSGRKIAVFEDPFYSFQAKPSATVVFARGHGWRAAAEVRHELQPSPLDAEHRERQVCVALRFAHRPNNADGVCSPGAAAGKLLALPSLGDCSAPASVVAFAAPAVRRVRLTLGDGSTRVRATQPLPFATDGERVAVFIAPRHLAMRSLEGLGPEGRRVARTGVGIEPADARCPRPGSVNAGSAIVLFGSSGLERPAPAPPAEPALLLRQRGEQLCLGIDRIQPLKDCVVPSAEEDLFEQAERHYTDGSVAYAGIVDPRIATVTAIDAEGRRVTIPTQPLAPEAGAYAAVAKGFLLHLRHPAVVLRLHNAAGGLEYDRPTLDGFGPLAPFRVAARSHGVRLLVGRERAGTRTFGPCAVAVAGGQKADLTNCSLLLSDVGEVSVPCAPRRLIVVGRLPRRATGARLVLNSGATIAADVDPRTRGWVAAAPPTAGLRAIIVVGAEGYDARLSLPPAAEQCGYSSFFFSGRF